MAPFVPASTAAWRHSSGHERRKSTAANARSASCVQWRIVCERKVSTATGFASFMLLYAASAWDRALLSGDISVAISPWNSSTLMLERMGQANTARSQMPGWHFMILRRRSPGCPPLVACKFGVPPLPASSTIVVLGYSTPRRMLQLFVPYFVFYLRFLLYQSMGY